MTNAPTPEEFAAEAYAAVMEWDRERPRSQQSINFVVGMSELGHCSEHTRRMLAQLPEEPTDTLAAFIGTAIGDYVEQALQRKFGEDMIRQADVVTRLQGDLRDYNLTGHPDLIFPKWGIVDVKTVNGFNYVEQYGPKQQQQFQRHGYCLGAHQMGLLDVPLEEAMVANLWFDRSATEKRAYVHMEPFSWDVIGEATRWLDEVVYAYLNGTEAMKEPSRNFCEGYCGYYRDCRAFDTDVEGLITDPEQKAAADLYQQGVELERKAKRMKDEAKGALVGAAGSTGDYLVRWVHVNEVELPAVKRKGYDRLSISKIK